MTAQDVIILWNVFYNATHKHILKLLSFVQLTVASVAGVSGALSQKHLTIALVISSVLTAWKEFFGKDKA